MQDAQDVHAGDGHIAWRSARAQCVFDLAVFIADFPSFTATAEAVGVPTVIPGQTPTPCAPPAVGVLHATHVLVALAGGPEARFLDKHGDGWR